MSRRPCPILRQEPEGGKNETVATLADSLRRQFRIVMKVLTLLAPEPKPRRRRKDESNRGFRAAARNVLRRAVRLPAIATVAEFLWDTLDWLNPWLGPETDGESEMDEKFYHPEQNGLFPRP
jgi:hypothetical protein